MTVPDLLASDRRQGPATPDDSRRDLNATLRYCQGRADHKRLCDELWRLGSRLSMSRRGVMSHSFTVLNKPFTARSTFAELTAAELTVAREALVEHVRELEIAAEAMVGLIDERELVNGN